MDQAMASVTATLGPLLAAIGAFYIAWHLVKLVPRITSIKAALIALLTAATVLYIVQDVQRIINLGAMPYRAIVLILDFLNGILDSLAQGVKKG